MKAIAQMHLHTVGSGKVASLAALLLVGLLLAGCNFSLAADVTPPPGYHPQPAAAATPDVTAAPIFPLVPPDPVEGQAIFTEKCAPCHGENGLGSGPRAGALPNPPAAIGSAELARQAIPADWYRIVTEGRLEKMMPPFQSLSDRQRWDVVAYALTLSQPPASLEEAAALYQQNCVDCHGPDGKGDGPKAASIKPADFSHQEFMASRSEAGIFKSISDGGKEMPAFGDKLSEAQRWALAGYLRNLSFASSSQQASNPTPAVTGSLEAPAASQPLTNTASISSTKTLGVITGLVMNASGQPLPEGTQIMMHSFDNMLIIDNLTTTLKADGTYSFENIDMPEGRSFLTTVEYSGVPYGSDISAVQAGQTSLQLPIQVYETTSDTSGLTVDRLHYFFQFSAPEMLQVGELYVISNPGDHTVVPAAPDKPVLEFELPKGATNLQFQDGKLGDGRYIATDKGFGDASVIRPGMGNYQVLFSYDLPYPGKLTLSRPVSMPVDAMVILVPQGGPEVSGEGISDAGTRDVQGTQYRMYNANGLKAGSELNLSISGASSSGGSAGLSSGSNGSLLLGLGVLGVVLIAAGVWMYRRSRAMSADEADVVDGGQEPVQESSSAESLMDAILALDDQYQEGKLPEDAYRKRRAELKEQLKKQMAGDQPESQTAGRDD